MGTIVFWGLLLPRSQENPQPGLCRGGSGDSRHIHGCWADPAPWSLQGPPPGRESRGAGGDTFSGLGAYLLHKLLVPSIQRLLFLNPLHVLENRIRLEKQICPRINAKPTFKSRLSRTEDPMEGLNTQLRQQASGHRPVMQPVKAHFPPYFPGGAWTESRQRQPASVGPPAPPHGQALPAHASPCQAPVAYGAMRGSRVQGP